MLAKALYELGVQANEINLYEEAVPLFLECLSLKPKYQLALFDLGYSYFKLGKFTDCIEVSERANIPEAWLNAANAKLYLNDISGAISTALKVTETNPNHRHATAVLILAFLATGKRPDIINILNHAKSFLNPIESIYINLNNMKSFNPTLTAKILSTTLLLGINSKNLDSLALSLNIIPISNWNSQQEALKITAARLKRSILPGEVIAPLDGNWDNTSSFNLKLFPSIGAMNDYTTRMERLDKIIARIQRGGISTRRDCPLLPPAPSSGMICE
jgi:tetratricopeptide (TPR) repeat protein